MLLTWQSINRGSLCQQIADKMSFDKSMNMTQTKPPLSRVLAIAYQLQLDA